MSIAEDPEKTREIDMQAEKIRELVRARGPACPETKRRAAALLSATLAGGVAAPLAAPVPVPATPAPVVRAAKLGLVLLAGLIALACAGCATLEPETVDMVKAALAHNLATSEDPRVSADARAEAEANADVDAVILRDATGEPLPPEVQARLDAHRAGGR